MSYTAVKHLIAYAGHDGPRKQRDLSPYSLFHLYKMDTHQIAQRLGLAEHIVLKRITQARDHAHGTRTEFEGRA